MRRNETGDGIRSFVAEPRVPFNDTDWVLAEETRSDDDQAFTALMERYQRPILNFVFRMIGDPSEAEDVAQEVFVRAYRGIHAAGFRRTTAAFSTWLFQIARHAALDALRRRKRHPTESLADLETRGEPVADAGRTAAEETVIRETGKHIAAAVALLPEDQRTAIVLSEYEGLSYSQIAAIMNCSEKSVETRLYRARRFLRRQLTDLLR